MSRDTDGDGMLDGSDFNPVVAFDITPILDLLLSDDDDVDTDGDGVSDADELAEGSNPYDANSTACVTPDSGDWTITRRCTLFTTKTFSENLFIQNNAVMTIPNGISLDLNLSTKKLVVQSGSGVLVQQGGSLR